MKQGDNIVEFETCHDAAYLRAMSDELKKGMVMTFGLWGGTDESMAWFDSKTGCTGNCNANQAWALFSNISIKDNEIARNPFTQ